MGEYSIGTRIKVLVMVAALATMMRSVSRSVSP